MHMKEDRTQKLGQNNTYVSIGILFAAVGGALWISSGLSDLKQEVGVLNEKMSGYSTDLEDHEKSPYHQGVADNFVSNNQYDNLAEDVRDVKSDIKTMSQSLQTLLIELRSITFE